MNQTLAALTQAVLSRPEAVRTAALDALRHGFDMASLQAHGELRARVQEICESDASDADAAAALSALAVS